MLNRNRPWRNVPSRLRRFKLRPPPSDLGRNPAQSTRRLSMSASADLSAMLKVAFCSPYLAVTHGSTAAVVQVELNVLKELRYSTEDPGVVKAATGVQYIGHAVDAKSKAQSVTSPRTSHVFVCCIFCFTCKFSGRLTWLNHLFTSLSIASLSHHETCRGR